MEAENLRENMTLLLGTTAKPKQGIDIAYMGKMMSFTFGAVLFILVLLLMDLYDRRCSAYVKEKLCGKRRNSKKLSNSSDDIEDGIAVLHEHECKPGTSTSQC